MISAFLLFLHTLFALTVTSQVFFHIVEPLDQNNFIIFLLVVELSCPFQIYIVHRIPFPMVAFPCFSNYDKTIYLFP